MSNDFLNWNDQDYCYYYQTFFSYLSGDSKKKYSEYQS